MDRSHVDEKFYEPTANYEDVFKLIAEHDDQTLEDMTKELVGDSPNTYTFTKALAEDLIRREAQDLPILVFRPTVVINTYREPVRGWIDNVYGPIGLMVGIGTGVIHVYYGDLYKITDMVPVDLVVNALICSTKETVTKRKVNGDIPIYTCSSSGQKPINWKEIENSYHRYGLEWPPIRAVWYASYWLTNNLFLYRILDFFCHTIPGYILDILMVINGKKPMFCKIYKKFNKVIDTINYFKNNQWTFVNDNLLNLWDTQDNRDKELFNFDIYQIDWDYFLQALYLGLRIYLVKDDIHTLPAARKKRNKLRIAHYGLLTVVYGLLLYSAWYVLSLVL